MSFALAVASCLSAPLSCACQDIERLKKNCIEGEMAACEKACERKVAGEAGCFAAGRALQRAGGLDFGSEAFLRAKGCFERSCEGRFGDGCLYAAQLIEAPFASADPAAMSKKPPPLMSDGDLARRQEFLERACAEKSLGGCKRLGEAAIGKNTELAKRGYVAACRQSERPDECEKARTEEIAIFETFRADCQRGVMDACETLGNLVFRLDVPRAVRLFAAEGATRGVLKLAGGLGPFLMTRTKEAMTARVADPRASKPAAPAPPLPAWVTFGKARVSGRLARVSVERLIERSASAPISRCVENHAGGPRAETLKGAVTVLMTVDTTGDVWRVHAKASELPASATKCVVEALSGLQFPTAGSGTATVEYSVSFDEPGADAE